MSGFGEDWGSWRPHPSLANQWHELSKLSSQGPQNLDVSRLLIRLIDSSVPISDRLVNSIHEEVDCTPDKQLPVPMTQSGEDCSQSSQPLTQIKSQGFPYLSQSGEDHDLPFFMELNGALESHDIPLSEDLVSSLSELPQQAYPQLLCQLQEELTSEGLNTLLELVGEDIQGSLEQNTWLHPALICKFILLPKVTCPEDCSNEVLPTLEEFARICPKIVIVQILQPLLLNEGSMNIRSELVRSVISCVPVEHHLYLIKFVLEQSEAPLPISQLDIFLTVLGATNVDLTVVLSKLMALLEKSATSLAENGPFSNLLLMVIQKLPPNTPQSVHDRLANILRQNKSFNKQALLNALKERSNFNKGT